MCVEEVLLEGEWEEPVNAADSFWQVEDGAYLLLSVEKGRENWWGAVLKGEQRIDTTKVCSCCVLSSSLCLLQEGFCCTPSYTTASWACSGTAGATTAPGTEARAVGLW